MGVLFCENKLNMYRLKIDFEMFFNFATRSYSHETEIENREFESQKLSYTHQQSTGFIAKRWLFGLRWNGFVLRHDR